MLSKILSGAIMGVEGYTVSVEVDASNGFPAMDIVGLPDSAIKESKERVRAAISNSGFVFPTKRITINLAPADIKKEGPSFDLPIAVGIMVCTNLISEESVDKIFFAGELSLDGEIKPINGILPMVYNQFKEGIKTCVVSVANADEAALVSGLDIIPIKNLQQLVAYLNGRKIQPHKIDLEEIFATEYFGSGLDFADVKGQENVKRALEIAASGMHNALMIGPPGSGKTMMAKRLPTILPDLSFDESIDVTKVYSVSGLIQDKNSLIIKRPFRSPHHTISYAALTGGGRNPKPGEISLSHNGILFLDELPEFHKNVLEILRQPLEEKVVTIARVNGTITYPSNFMLIASMNPCPCGFYGDIKKCTCSPTLITKYLGKISGPLLDRIDIQVEAPKVEYDDLGSGAKAESSLSIKQRIIRVNNLQKERYREDGIRYNSELTAAQIEKYCVLDEAGKTIVRKAFDIMGLSARAYHKILKLARTIADINESENISSMHLAEAIQYRSLDRKYWK